MTSHKKSSVSILLMFILTTIFAQEPLDSTKVWNGKWNPDDPLCPCHKIQKQAEDEYKKSKEKEEQKNQALERKNDIQAEKGHRLKEQTENKNIARQNNDNITVEIEKEEKEKTFATVYSAAGGKSEAKTRKKISLKKARYKLKKEFKKLFKKSNRRPNFSDECVFNFT